MPIAERDFEFVCALVRRRAAIVIEPGKEYLVEARLDPLATDCGFGSPSALIDSLRRSPSEDLAERVVEVMAINETSFFRDVHPFQTLRDQILPGLIEKRARRRSLSLWCAASSTGQEPYSVALLLAEMGIPLDTWHVQLIASDISAAALRRASAGRYTQQEVNRGLPAQMLVRYFEREGLKWRINEGIRRRVNFQQINLARAWPALPPMDLIILRNVMIYFDLPTKRQILERVRACLNPDGFLLVGAAETVTLIDERFEPVYQGKTLWYQLRE